MTERNFAIKNGLTINNGVVLSPTISQTANSNINLNLFSGDTFLLSLTGNANLSTSNAIDGRQYEFIIIQNNGGNWSFTWDSSFIGAQSITTANSYTANGTVYIQSFKYISTANVFYARTAMNTIF